MTQSNSSVRPWARALLIFPPFIVAVVLFQFGSSLVLGLHHPSVPKTLFQQTVEAFFTVLATLLSVGVFRRFVDRQSFQSMGFYPKGFRHETLTGLGLGFLIMATGFAVLISLNEIQWTGIHVDIGRILLGILLFGFVALAEELLMRGYILNNLMQSMNRFVALLVSSLLFSALHLLNSNITLFSFLNILLAGILLGLPYIYTQRLWLPLALHFSWNFFQGTIFGFSVSGNPTYSLVTQTRAVDDIWNGGRFGFEGSIFSAVFVIISIFILWKKFSNRTEKSAVQK